MKRIKNATPHKITIVGNDGELITTIEPSGKIARLGVEREQIDAVNGIPINSIKNVEDPDCWVPPVEKDTIWIVSKIFADALAGRNDLVFPDDTVRDEQGRITGCRALGRTGQTEIGEFRRLQAH